MSQQVVNNSNQIRKLVDAINDLEKRIQALKSQTNFSDSDKINSHKWNFKIVEFVNNNQPLPKGWDVRICYKNNTPYYLDHNTKTTTWKRPFDKNYIDPIQKNIQNYINKFNHISDRYLKLTHFEEICSYLNNPERISFINRYTVFKHHLKEKMIQLFTDTNSRVIYRTYRDIYGTRIPLL